jgi:hypothetical protein
MQLLIARGLFWLVTELFLSMVELDQLADYSEFIFRLKDDMALQRDKIVRLMNPKDSNLPVSHVSVESAPRVG